MSDLISREKLKDYLDKNISFGGVEKKFAFFDIIDSIPSAENKGEWIPVSERLPAIDKKVEKYLITDEEGNVRTACFIRVGDDCFWDYLFVVAWMPLPEPYKAESEE